VPGIHALKPKNLQTTRVTVVPSQKLHKKIVYNLLGKPTARICYARKNVTTCIGEVA